MASPADGRARALELVSVFLSDNVDVAESELARLSDESPEFTYWTILALVGLAAETTRRLADVTGEGELDVLAEIDRDFERETGEDDDEADSA